MTADFAYLELVVTAAKISVMPGLCITITAPSLSRALVSPSFQINICAAGHGIQFIIVQFINIIFTFREVMPWNLSF